MIHDASYNYQIDVICLPELCFTKLLKDFEKEFRAIVSAASEYNVTIISGAFTGKIAGNVYVSCPFIASDRSILGRQLFVWLSKKKIQIWFNIVLGISFIGSRISLWQSSYFSIMYSEVGDILISLVIYNCS
jgi:predicted amidohydrolase